MRTCWMAVLLAGAVAVGAAPLAWTVGPRSGLAVYDPETETWLYQRAAAGALAGLPSEPSLATDAPVLVYSLQQAVAGAPLGRLVRVDFAAQTELLITPEWTDTEVYTARYPAISADGSTIAFHGARFQLEPDKVTYLDGGLRLWRATPDGTGEIIELTDDPEDLGITRPLIAANGRWMVFASRRGGGIGFWRLTTHAGATPEPLGAAGHPDLAGLDELSLHSYDLSADGRWLVFPGNLRPDAGEQHGVFVADVQTGQIERLGELAGAVAATTISADGSRVAVALVNAERQGLVRRLVVLSRTNPTVRRTLLETTDGDIHAIDLSPDGETVAVARAAFEGDTYPYRLSLLQTREPGPDELDRGEQVLFSEPALVVPVPYLFLTY